jgi:uracil-DNA glycosylase
MLDSLASIRDKVLTCTRCEGLSQAIYPFGKEIGLAYVRPRIPTEILFVAESPPGRQGSFFYDNRSPEPRFRNRLFQLITKSGLGPVRTIEEFNEKGYYLADVINCRWEKSVSKNPNELVTIRQNCLGYLSDQIQILRPRGMVFMGAEARKALNTAEIGSLIRELNISRERIIEIPFILTAPVKTEDIVEKMRVLSC